MMSAPSEHQQAQRRNRPGLHHARGFRLAHRLTESPPFLRRQKAFAGRLSVPAHRTAGVDARRNPSPPLGQREHLRQDLDRPVGQTRHLAKRMVQLGNIKSRDLIKTLPAQHGQDVAIEYPPISSRRLLGAVNRHMNTPEPMPVTDATDSTETMGKQVLAAYGLSVVSMEPVGHGLINRTWRVRAPGGACYALQRLNPVLDPEIHEHIEAVTVHIAAQGMPTPRLLHTPGGGLCMQRKDGVWRVLSWLEGKCRSRLENARQAEQAGALLARFHRALTHFDRPLAGKRRPIHEPPRRFAELDRALTAHPDHPLHGEAGKLRRRTMEIVAGLPPMPATPARVAHGDPKIDNMLFTSAGEGLAMVDLDSLARLSLPLELGDAFRSWCNPAGEDSARTEFSEELFRAARSGYLAVADFITDNEKSRLVDATLWITLELTARFAADILNDSYFGWNPERFASRSQHNLIRARGQLRLAESLLAQRPSLRD